VVGGAVAGAGASGGCVWLAKKQQKNKTNKKQNKNPTQKKNKHKKNNKKHKNNPHPIQKNIKKKTTKKKNQRQKKKNKKTKKKKKKKKKKTNQPLLINKQKRKKTAKKTSKQKTIKKQKKTNTNTKKPNTPVAAAHPRHPPPLPSCGRGRGAEHPPHPITPPVFFPSVPPLFLPPSRGDFHPPLALWGAPHIHDLHTASSSRSGGPSRTGGGGGSYPLASPLGPLSGPGLLGGGGGSYCALSLPPDGGVPVPFGVRTWPSTLTQYLRGARSPTGGGGGVSGEGVCWGALGEGTAGLPMGFWGGVWGGGGGGWGGLLGAAGGGGPGGGGGGWGGGRGLGGGLSPETSLTVSSTPLRFRLKPKMSAGDSLPHPFEAFVISFPRDPYSLVDFFSGRCY